MVEWGDADDDGYPDTEEGHNEYEKDCQSGKQPWKGHKIFHDRYRSSIVEAYLTQLLPFELFSKKFCLNISELGFEIV